MDYLDQVKAKLLETIAQLVQIEATARMRSRTLRRDLTWTLDVADMQVTFNLPYYWAEFHHDGRAGIDMPPGKFLVFFPNSRDDPRTAGGTAYPQSRADVRHLTSDQFKHFAAINRANARAGLPPVMVVTRSVGPDQGRFFFSLAWQHLLDSGVVDELVAASITHYLESGLA